VTSFKRPRLTATILEANTTEGPRTSVPVQPATAQQSSGATAGPSADGQPQSKRRRTQSDTGINKFIQRCQQFICSRNGIQTLHL